MATVMVHNPNSAWSRGNTGADGHQKGVRHDHQQHQ
jgi:hypothetical protein